MLFNLDIYVIVRVIGKLVRLELEKEVEVRDAK